MILGVKVIWKDNPPDPSNKKTIWNEVIVMSRIKNWDENYNQESAGARLMQYKPIMRERLKLEFKIQVMIENEVKKIMGESGLPTWHNIPYLNFGRQVYKVNRHTYGKTQIKELALLMKLARMKRLNKQMLVKIRDKILELPVYD